VENRTFKSVILKLRGSQDYRLHGFAHEKAYDKRDKHDYVCILVEIREIEQLLLLRRWWWWWLHVHHLLGVMMNILHTAIVVVVVFMFEFRRIVNRVADISLHHYY